MSRLLFGLLISCSAMCLIAETRELDIGIAVFDPGLDADPSHYKKLGIFPEIRKLEARYLPFVLRRTLEYTDQWGSIRVLPTADPISELLITGKILHSDGISLKVGLVAADSSGKQWLSKIYSGIAVDADYQSDSSNKERPFQELYDRVGEDLLTAANAMPARHINSLQQLSLLRYAETLAPDAFAGYVANSDSGYLLQRLPARDDPMLQRIQHLREQELLFVDTVDEQYATLFVELGPTYSLWRQVNREQALYERLRKDSRAGRDTPRRGSYESMKSAYSNFRWAKIQEQESEKLAEGFNNETQPTFLTIQDRVVKLSGSLEDQYREWRRILRSIFQLEYGESNEY